MAGGRLRVKTSPRTHSKNKLTYPNAILPISLDPFFLSKHSACKLCLRSLLHPRGWLIHVSHNQYRKEMTKKLHQIALIIQIAICSEQKLVMQAFVPKAKEIE